MAVLYDAVMKKAIILYAVFFFCHEFSLAQDAQIIEPSLMEVSYHETFGKYSDDYALRIGKTTCQYFSYHSLRDDSLLSNKETSMIILKEKLDEAYNRSDPSKQRASGPDHGDYLYKDFIHNVLTTYTSVMGEGYKVTEAVPEQKWTINTDSSKLILGYNCSLATTLFRGREWKVWYTDEVSASSGPWKLGGLPGLILSASVDGYITIDATAIKFASLTPVMFYNFYNKKYREIDREKFLKVKNNPSTYPPKTIFIPQMELE